MNRFHLWYCQSARWSRNVDRHLLPWALSKVDLGPTVLELGPGLGVTTRWLAQRIDDLTVVELDPALAAQLEQGAQGRFRVVHGDATALPQPDRSFTGVVSFTMLHHLPSAQAQDQVFAEAFRVLAPGGVFAGTDSRLSLRFRLYHVADTMTPIDPADLPARLAAAGFVAIDTSTTRRSTRFRARRPQ